MEREVVLKKFKECGYSIYDASYAENDTAGYVLGKKAGVKHLIIIGDAPKGFVGEPVRLGDLSLLVCPLRHENAESLKKAFPWLKPVSVENRGISIGTGDRLGLVTKAHIMAVSGTGVFPVLAQQSMRELKLTGKTNLSMLDDVLWQVFEAGYRDGYAADGDHLKEIDDIKAALADGDTMITLDCSEHIPSGKAPGAAALAALFAKYCGRAFDLGKDLIKITPVQLDEIIAVYSEAIDFIEEVYRTVILPCSHTVSFEISIDETDTSTTPEAHFFLASELRKRGVRFSSLAPRFCGEFQKGIDYIGDHAQFEAELRRHAIIAEHFGYRISVHSGSDKFSVFPYVGKECRGKFHLKTSGTSWVEALRVVAMCEPNLFRRMLKYSCIHFEEAQKSYHVTAQVENVPDIDKLSDQELPALMDLKDTRQVMHITYGFLLQSRGETGAYLFRDELYEALDKNEALLQTVVSAHIRKHLHYLGLC